MSSNVFPAHWKKVLIQHICVQAFFCGIIHVASCTTVLYLFTFLFVETEKQTANLLPNLHHCMLICRTPATYYANENFVTMLNAN